MIFYMVMNDMCALAGVALFVSVGALTCVSVNSSVTKKTGKGRGTLDIESVFGKPVQELTVKWTALQSNMSRYRLFVGRMVPYHCRILKQAICIRVSRKKGESFSCYIGKDVLGQLFQWHELTEERACVKDQHTWCDGFCVNLTSQTYLATKACDAQSCPLVSSYFSWWRLLLEAKCQSPRNLSVTFRKDHTMVISWLPPPLVWKNSTIYYVLFYNVTNILNETIFQTDSFDIGKNKLNYTLTNVQSFSKYGISVGCRYSMLRPLGSSPGLHIYKEFTSLEEVPSESPKCEVLNRTMSGTALILLKPPPKSSWNGIPTRYVLFYDNGEEENYSLNISLQGVNEIKVWVNYTDVNKSRAVKATICNGAGCRRSLGQPCFIDRVDIPEITNKAAIGLPEPSKSVTTWIVVAASLGIGFVLVVVFICSFKKRKRRSHQLTLDDRLVGSEPNNVTSVYENDDERPNLCEESEYYDTVCPRIGFYNMGNSTVENPESEL